MKLLYAGPENGLAERAIGLLLRENYRLDRVQTLLTAMENIRSAHYDGILIDANLEQCNGAALLSQLRKENCTAPVLLFASSDSPAERIRVLDLGADDCLSQTFDPEEFLARVRAMLRRRETYAPVQLSFGDISLNPKTFTLHCGAQSTPLSKLEYALLETLITNPGVTISSEDLLTRIWGCRTDAELGSVWVYISYLRRKLKAVGAHVRIHARRSVGYQLEETD